MKVEGKNAVTEAIKSGKTIDKIILQNGTDTRDMINLAKENGIKFQFVDRKVIDDESVTKKHQGVIAYSTDFKYCTLQDIISFANDKNENAFVLILDGVEDPHNLGSILRVAECAGVHGIVIPKNRAVPVNETVIKVSAGASERVKVAKVVNINQAIEELKQNGIFVYAADMDGEIMYNTNLTGSIAIVIGGEGKGVSKLTKKLCDAVVSIPMFGKINSLNASVSAGIVLFEAVRQKTAKEGKKFVR